MAASENEGQAQMFLRELTQQVQTLKGVGPAISAKLNKAGIVTAADILLRYPRQDRYEDRITRRPLVSVVPFPAMPDISHNISASRELTTVVKIIDISNMYIQKKRIPCIIVSDGTAQARLLAFRHPDIERTLAMGESYLLWGNFSYSEKYRKIQSSDFEIERENAPPEALAKKHFNEILPVYRLEQGLRQWHYRTLTAAALAQYGDKIDDELPPELLEKYRLMSKKNAVRAIHFPRGFDELRQAQKTLIFEELFYLEMLIAQRAYSRKKRAAVSPNAAVSPDTAVSPNAAAPSAAAGDCTPLQRRLVERLPFKLTDGQRQALREINAGLDNPPEARLLQGDVGSGKTLVSFLAALKTVEGGGQAVIMAPTELLAYQHAENAAALLEPLGIRAAFLTGHVKAAGRKHLLSALAAGEIDIVAGTHALFSRDVVYKNLRLAVIDEQHRFGVTQRQA
ncbi:MAG: DEAD/DEAH box helicase, partial [Spirochaetaceae bacterium]|nr:DEAD/DEAH box helicase [Spirochaetaceae bacterium]